MNLGPVVRLRLTLQQENGDLAEAVLLIPRERYDGMRVIELFEKHKLAGTTRVVRVEQTSEAECAAAQAPEQDEDAALELCL